MKKPSGLILWQDETRVLIALLKSANRKTKNMVQTYLILKNIDPRDAIKNGKDKAICGDCKHRMRYDRARKKRVRTCYVNIGQGVMQVYKAYHRGNYVDFNPSIHAKYLAGRVLRIGSYGDPAFVPVELWESFMMYFAYHTGYTHQWQKCDPRYRKFLMASADSKSETELANKMGYRSFVVVPHDAKLEKQNDLNAVQCVNSSHDKSCEECRLCNGNYHGTGKNVWINAHGPSKRFLMNLA